MSEVQTEILTVAEIEVSAELKNIIEALIFASDEPMSVRFIRSIMDEVNKELLPHEQIIVNAEIIRKAVGELNRGYTEIGTAFRIIEIAGGFVHATQEQFATWVGKLAKERARRRLSPTAIETLAIIAYKQPITKTEVEFIRGVNADYIINALLEKDLIHITGRQNTPGRPLLYGTTQKFLEHFGLNELTDLPKPREIAELINETELEVDRRLLAEQQELEFRDSLENKLEGHEGAAKKEKEQKQPKVKQQAISNSPPREVKDEKSEISMQNIVTDEIVAQSQPFEIAVEMKPENVIPVDEIEETGSLEASLQNESIEPIESKVETVADEDEQLKDVALINSESTISQHEILDVVEFIEQEATEPTKVFDEEGVELLTSQESKIEEINHSAAGSIETLSEFDPEREQGTGWSKWKSKVKTFFKKLFG